MKKSLIALAVASAMPLTSVMAQNVSLYGVIDHSQGTKEIGTAVNNSSNTASDSVLTSGRWGLVGSEDLGGGLKANFRLEAPLTLSTGAGAGDTLFGREATVGLSGDFGAVRLGKLSHWVTDIDTFVSVAGNMGNVGNENGVAIDRNGDKKDGSIAYETPTINGLSAQLGYAQETTNGTFTNVSTHGTFMGATVRYQNGPLLALLGTGTTEVSTTAKIKTNKLGVQYDFGAIRAGLTMARLDPNTDTQNDQFKVNILTAALPLGNGLELIAALHRVSEGSTGVTSENKASSTALGVTKALSKRTTLYGVYTSTDNKSNLGYAMSSQLSTATTDGQDRGTMAAGIRHTF